MNTQKGVIILELLIALVISAVVSIAVVTFYSGLIGSNSELYARQQLSEQLKKTVEIFEKHLVRAGYWSGSAAQVASGSYSNPFTGASVDISTNVANDCILFAYDYSQSGVTVPSIGTTPYDEHFGFRLMTDSSSGNGVVQMRPLSLATYQCNDSYALWSNLTNPNNVNVTNLSFVIETRTSPTIDYGQVSIRIVDISVTGQHSSNSNITETISSKVRVKNDKFTAI